MSYGRTLAIKKRNNKNFLFMQLEEAGKYLAIYPDHIETKERYTHLKQQIEIIITAETEGERIRSGQTRADEGENA